MNVSAALNLPRLAAASVLSAGLLLASPVAAQQAPASAAGNSAKPGTAPQGGLGAPAGKGAGVHAANSPFPPLAARADVVPWSVLTDVKVKAQKDRIVPIFTAAQLGLHQKTQRIQGFMMPLDPGATQRHFLLSSVPLTCAFCMPGGPESMVEVKSKTPVKYSMEPVVVEGHFQVLNDDEFGMYYRVTDASSVR